MLSGEGMQRQRTLKNNNRSNWQKSNFAPTAHFFCKFLFRCFARLQRETSRNFLVARFMEEMSYVFSFTFFSLPLIFTLHWWPLAFLILSTPLKIFKLFLKQNIMSILFFISRSGSLSPFCLLSFAGLPPTFSFSLSFSCTIFQICGHDSLAKRNTLDNTDTEKISDFRFRLY